MTPPAPHGSPSPGTPPHGTTPPAATPGGAPPHGTATVASEPTPPPPPPSARRPLRQLLAASVGNAVEWYDWYAYTFLAAYLANQVFPKSSGNSLVPLLSTFAVFAVGFFMRPVGGLLMGALADRRGRRTALTVTILLMGGSSLLVGLTPTYAAAGVLAPVVLVIARLLQGLSVGGVRGLDHLPRRVGGARPTRSVLLLPVRLHLRRTARRLRHRRPAGQSAG